jgi:hypothetical protein
VAPAAPTATATPYGSTITVRWTPGDTGGAAIQGYTVSIAKSNSGPGPDTLTCSGAAPLVNTPTLITGTSCTATGYAGAAYSATVIAVNSAGDSPASTAATATVAAVPAPSGIGVKTGTDNAVISWTPITNYEGITGYTVSYTIEGGSSPQTVTADGASAGSATLSGLTSNKTYTVTIKANVSTGDVTTSEAVLVTPVVPVEPPASLPPAAGDLAPTGDTDTTPAPGETMTITGSGYAPNSIVTVVIYSSPITLGQVQTDGNGNFSLAVSVPQSVLGKHTIASLGYDSNGNLHVLTLPVTVTKATSRGSSGGSGGGDGLAITGAPVMAMMLLGAALLVVGGASRYAGGRRRRDNS